MARAARADKNKEILSLRLDRTHIDALKNLEPMYGNSSSEVIRFIITEWLSTKMGNDWMKGKGLIK